MVLGRKMDALEIMLGEISKILESSFLVYVEPRLKIICMCIYLCIYIQVCMQNIKLERGLLKEIKRS